MQSDGNYCLLSGKANQLVFCYSIIKTNHILEFNYISKAKYELIEVEYMKLHTTTDYGIRVMCCLYSKDTLITANELSEQLGISYGYLNKVLGCLRQADMVEVLHGRFGGYQIAKSARKVTLYDIIRVMEGEIQINSCLGEDSFCNRDAIEICLVRAALESAQNELINNLRRVRLADISETAGRKYGLNGIHTALQRSMGTSD